MNTTDPSILKKFYTVLNREELTEKIYETLLKRWDLDKVDLNKEQEKINQRKSGLSRSRRLAVPEFLILRRILDEKKEETTNTVDMNLIDETENLENDQIIL